MIHRLFLTLLFILTVAVTPVFGTDGDLKKVLILYEHVPAPVSGGLGDARQLRQLLGHFAADATLKEVSSYRAGEMSHYDFTFYIGYTKRDLPPGTFMEDAFETEKPFIWLNTGMEAFASQFDVGKRFGFKYVRFDTASVYDVVLRGNQRFTKTEPNANVIKVIAPAQCQVLATAKSTRTRTTIPYVIRRVVISGTSLIPRFPMRLRQTGTSSLQTCSTISSASSTRNLIQRSSGLKIQTRSPIPPSCGLLPTCSQIWGFLSS